MPQTPTSGHSTVKLLAVAAFKYIIKVLMAFSVQAGDATYAASMATAQLVVRPCGAACSGYDHACAFRLNGTLECFGANQHGATNVPAQNVSFTGFRVMGMLHASSDPTQRWSAGVPLFLHPGHFLPTISCHQGPALLTSLWSCMCNQIQ